MRTAGFCAALLFVSAVIADDEEKIPLARVPPAVIRAVKAKYPGATLSGAEKEMKDGETVYEIAFGHQGQKYEAELKPDGTMIAVDREIATRDLPAVVSEAVKKRWPGATIKDAEEVTRDSTISYEVHISLARAERIINAEATLDRNGAVLDFQNPETHVPLSKLPPAVLTAVRTRFPGARLIKAAKETEANKLIYEVVLDYKSQRLEAEFDPGGGFLETEVSIKLDDLPRPVTAILQKHYPEATYRHADKVTNKEGEVSYEVVVELRDGRRGEVVLNPEGKILKAPALNRPAAGQR